MATRGLIRQKGNRNLLNVQYMKRIEDEMKGMIANFSQTFEQRGAICDSEGFYQHIGECWSDALQMIFLWTDGFKEVVQRKLASALIDDTFMNTIDDSEILKMYRSYIAHTYNTTKLTNVQEREFVNKFKQTAIAYLKIVQHRFMRHYTTEVERRHLHETCSSDIPEARYYARLMKISGFLHVKGKNAIESERMGKEENRRGKAGGNNEDIYYLLHLYNIVFFDSSLDYQVTQGGITEDTQYTNAVFIGIEQGKAGHAICFYTCGGVDFLYDDNYGPFPFEWRLFCHEIANQMSLFNDYRILFTTCKITKHGTLYYTQYYPIIEVDGKCLTFFESTKIFLSKNPTTGIFSYTNEGIDIKTHLLMYHIGASYGITLSDASSPVENKGFKFINNARFLPDNVIFDELISLIDTNDIAAFKYRIQKMNTTTINFSNITDKGDQREKTTFLIYAIKKNRLEILDLLLKHPFIRLNYEIPDRYIPIDTIHIKFMPLTSAFFYKNTDLQIIKRLLNEPSLNLNTSITDMKHTLLQLMVGLYDIEGMPEKLDLLLESKYLDLQFHTKETMTALQIAYMMENFDVISKLCAKGAVVTFKIDDEDAERFTGCARKPKKPAALSLASASGPASGSAPYSLENATLPEGWKKMTNSSGDIWYTGPSGSQWHHPYNQQNTTLPQGWARMKNQTDEWYVGPTGSQWNRPSKARKTRKNRKN